MLITVFTGIICLIIGGTLGGLFIDHLATDPIKNEIFRRKGLYKALKKGNLTAAAEIADRIRFPEYEFMFPEFEEYDEMLEKAELINMFTEKKRREAVYPEEIEAKMEEMKQAYENSKKIYGANI